METLEERNLNRLRRGKMMLEYSDKKRSWGLAFALTVFFGWTGVHRYYLGHKLLALAILLVTILIVATFIAIGRGVLHSLESFGIILLLFQVFLFTEIILSFWYTSRVNRRLQDDLEIKYGVVSLSV